MLVRDKVILMCIGKLEKKCLAWILHKFVTLMIEKIFITEISSIHLKIIHSTYTGDCLKL